MQHNEFAALYATRTSGTYEGGILAIGIQPDGSIEKLCDGPEGFFPMAETAGYQPRNLGYNDGGNNGGSHNCPSGYRWHAGLEQCVPNDFNDSNR